MAGVQSSGTLLHKSARVRVACLASGVGRLRLHVENDLFETFLSVCGSSTPAPAPGTTARLHSNPDSNPCG